MMKISTLRTLSSLTADEAILSELSAEIERLEKADARKAEQKAVKANEYAMAHDAVMGVLTDTTKPVTVSEIFDSCQNDLPEGFTKNKISYGLRTYWVDEVVKTEGKVNTYTRKE